MTTGMPGCEKHGRPRDYGISLLQRVESVTVWSRVICQGLTMARPLRTGEERKIPRVISMKMRQKDVGDVVEASAVLGESSRQRLGIGLGILRRRISLELKAGIDQKRRTLLPDERHAGPSANSETHLQSGLQCGGHVAWIDDAGADLDEPDVQRIHIGDSRICPPRIAPYPPLPRRSAARPFRYASSNCASSA